MWKARVVGLVECEKCRKGILLDPGSCQPYMKTHSKKAWLIKISIFGSIRPTVPNSSSFLEDIFQIYFCTIVTHYLQYIFCFEIFCFIECKQHEENRASRLTETTLKDLDEEEDTEIRVVKTWLLKR